MNKNQILKAVGTNLVIALMLVSLGAVCFVERVQSVFSPLKSEVIFKGDESKPNVSFMINVYWGNEYLPSMLTTLKENKIFTTFFVGGMWISKFPEDFLSIVRAGHEIGNHGYFHKDGDKISYAENLNEINNTHKLVKSYTGFDLNLFAPPSGAYGENTIKAATELNYKVIMWSKDTIDWRDQDEDLIFSRVSKNLGNGDLILMHPTQATVKVLPRLIELCKQKNLNIVPVSQCL